MERAIYHNYGVEDKGSRQTTQNPDLLIRAAISNSIKIYTSFTFMSIGAAMKKNHATVIHMHNNHDVYYANFAEYRIYFDHCAFIVKKVSSLVAKAATSYIQSSRYNLDYMEELKRTEKARARKIEKMEGLIRSIKTTLKKSISHDEKLRLINDALNKKGDLVDPL